MMIMFLLDENLTPAAAVTEFYRLEWKRDCEGGGSFTWRIPARLAKEVRAARYVLYPGIEAARAAVGQPTAAAAPAITGGHTPGAFTETGGAELGVIESVSLAEGGGLYETAGADHRETGESVGAGSRLPGTGAYGSGVRSSGIAGAEAVVRGRLAEAVLESRVISDALTATGESGTDTASALSGTLEHVVRVLVQRYAIDRPHSIPGLVLGKEEGHAERATAGLYGGNLMSRITSLLRPYGMWYELAYDPAYPASGGTDAPETADTAPALIFTVRKGTDRTFGQQSSSRAIFAEALGNVASAVVRRGAPGYTVAYVAGADAAASAVWEEAGGPRRELFVRAAGLHKGETMTDEAYTALLQSYGREKLAAARTPDTVTCVLTDDGFPRYGRDFRVGDRCRLELPSCDCTADARLSGITQTVTPDGLTLTAEFTL